MPRTVQLCDLLADGEAQTAAALFLEPACAELLERLPHNSPKRRRGRQPRNRPLATEPTLKTFLKSASAMPTPLSLSATPPMRQAWQLRARPRDTRRTSRLSPDGTTRVHRPRAAPAGAGARRAWRRGSGSKRPAPAEQRLPRSAVGTKHTREHAPMGRSAVAHGQRCSRCGSEHRERDGAIERCSKDNGQCDAHTHGPRRRPVRTLISSGAGARATHGSMRTVQCTAPLASGTNLHALLCTIART
jgi:hypothetical protein